MTGLILTVCIALGISALCSFMEAALYSLPWSYVEQLRTTGTRAGQRIYKLRSNIDRPIAAILTLNTIANTAGAAIAGSFAASVLGDGNMPLFAAVFTVAVLIFSEILPKTLGVNHARGAAPFVGFMASALVLLLKPVIVVASWLTRFISPKNKAPLATEEDVNAMVGLLRRTGRIQPYEEAAILNILALDKKTVHDIMTPRIVAFTLPAAMSVKQAQEEAGLWHYSRIPVYGENNEDIVGLVARRRILEELAAGNTGATLASIMRPVHFVLETLPLDRALLQSLDERIHLQVVLDEFGQMAGVISLEDLLEAILGREIVDETDQVADLQVLARERRRKLLEN